MIPQRLTVRNFLCYREDVPPLDFAGIHVACLCGQNGHGKSALLDAITWALWGAARGRTADELISYGADDCRVELDFLSRDAPYRVIRARSRAGGRRAAGTTQLELQALGAGAPQPITGNTVRETQAKIVQTVGMDYDTFVNSAFLAQGRADEFTSKTPAERKAVLSRIMGLETYDRLQARARQRLSEAAAGASRAAGELSRMRADAAAIGDPSGPLAETLAALADLELRLLDQRRDAGKLRAGTEELRRQRDAATTLEERIEAANKDIAGLQAGLSSSEAHVEQWRALAERAESIREGYRGLEQARERFDAMEAARSRFDQLSAERNEIVRAIDGARSRLEARAEQLERRIEAELKPKAWAETELSLELDEARSRLEGLDAGDAEVAARRRELTGVSTEIGEAQTTAKRYETEGLEIRAKLDLLDNSGGRGAVCPLCQTPLGEDGCQRMAESYKSEIEEKRNLFRDNDARLKQLQSRQSAMEKDLARRERSLAAERRKWQGQLPRLEHGIAESRQAQEDLEAASRELEAVAESLEAGGFAEGERAELAAMDGKIASLGYDEEARQRSRAAMDELQSFQELHGQLAQAEESLPVELEAAKRAGEMLERRREELAGLQGQHAASVEAAKELPRLQAELDAAESALAQLEREAAEAAGRKGYLEGQLQRLEALKGEIETSSAQLSELEEDQAVYGELAAAFGKQGIQAMLIETVLPRLEEEANILLGRMTDNRMHVQLESQRQPGGGRGDPVETLQINVSDELGPRAYEMYSGGEAFRVNLALRIGLSKALAQRMGAPLPILFIDEGFGSQDAAGRERILDVIAAIEDDFDKIVVITHLEDMKDAFPVRIEVEKGDFGSTFQLG